MRLIVVCIAFLILASPAGAVSFGVSPASVEIDVESSGYGSAEFTIHDYSGEVQIYLEDIPLTVEPTTIEVTEGDVIEVRIFGDDSIGNETYEGKICLVGMFGGDVGAGVKVNAIVNHISHGNEVDMTVVVLNSSGNQQCCGNYPWGKRNYDTKDAVSNGVTYEEDIPVVTDNETTEENQPSIINPADDPPSSVPVTVESNINWALIAFCGMALILIGAGYGIWRHERRRNNEKG